MASLNFLSLNVPTTNGMLSTTLFYLVLVICPLFLYRYLSPRTLLASHPSPSSLTDMAGVRVSKILVHPIKSCRGISVQHSRYTPEGLDHDRKWCIIEAYDNVVITAREFPKMVLITPEIVLDPTSPHSGVLSVSFPKESGCEPFSLPLAPTQAILDGWKRIEKIMMFDVAMDAYISEALPSPPSRSPSVILSSYFGRQVYLVYKGPQPRTCDPTPTHPNLEAKAVFQDCFPLMVLSAESTTRVEEELRGHVGSQGIDERWSSESLGIERFRPNIVFQGAGPFAEDSWQEIRIGSMPDAPVISMVSKCTRCLLPNVSPDTGEKDPAVPFKTLMKFRRVDPHNKMKACLGCNGVPSSAGEVRVGDCVAARAFM
ncbi:MOSC N-terminal beta barrel domain-containing protein [Mycena alexandri]|uniref:MOSC N-terminal beta barrel domain-containing protein n=1 Tax=Mycena alexandri TaxID=1745969 RepID=A0AAD6SCE8_9AGAR|nr:MOSC N-terminal beta barrel domain-containing protein [Mycena alexandri]